MNPNRNPRLSSEMLATGDALRHVVAEVLALVDAHSPLVVNLPATAIVLVDGMRVVSALEALAQCLDGQEAGQAP